MNIQKMIKIQMLCVGVASLFFMSATYSASDEAYIIFNNVSGTYDAAIFSNMRTSNNASCTKNDVLSKNKCNRFALGQNEIQVVQNDGTGKIISMIGVDNKMSTSYGNKGTEEQSYLFSIDKYLFNIDKLRTVANNISTLDTNLPSGSYGTISFQQFVNNIATGQTMYGIVRVKIPLLDTAKLGTPPAGGSSDSGNDNSSDSNSSDNSSGSGSDNSSEDGNDNSNDDSSDNSSENGNDNSNDVTNHVPTFEMCGDAGASACANECGLGKNSIIKAGMELCGITLPNSAQINIMGALLIDWVDYDTKDTISLDAFPSNPQDVSFEIALPLNINPSNVHNLSQTMSSIQAIQGLTGSNRCASGNVCDVEITDVMNFSLVPVSSRESYKYKFDTTLTEVIFDGLSRVDQYSLLFPSGYAGGWSTALNALNVSATQWQQWGLYVENDNTGAITINSIRNNSFEDIPALVYTGGLVRITHHTNISGLIYAAQAFEINQKGNGGNNVIPETCVPTSSCSEGSNHGSDNSSSNDGSSSDNGSDGTTSSNDGSSSDNGSDGTTSNNDGSSSDNGSDGTSSSNDGSSNDSTPASEPVMPSNPNTEFTPSFQYLDGAIVVRDGFYFEAIKPHGITLVNNNPDTYSNIEIKRIGGKNNFMSYSDKKGRIYNENDTSTYVEMQFGAALLRAAGAKWVEIRPK